ncbi:MAG: hypothetical protein FWC87_16040 [Acidimicrobiaceae bacterium]|nr:hypothetical protein [Acidimicrobiaceae bacterium]
MTGDARTGDALLADWSTDLSGRDVPGIEQARPFIPPGTRVYVGFLGREDFPMRVAAARAARRCGFVPVPIIAARRLASEDALRGYLTDLASEAAVTSVMVVGGDPATPLGPYDDAASVIGTGLLEEHGVAEVSIPAYPGGHPVIPADVLWSLLTERAATLEARGFRSEVITQFGFDADEVLAWLADLRARGITLPVQVGVPGPAAARLLVSTAAVCGVAVGAEAARAYGLAPADPDGTVGPERFLGTLLTGYDPRVHGDVRLHFNSFAGITPTAEWIVRWISDRAPQ